MIAAAQAAQPAPWPQVLTAVIACFALAFSVLSLVSQYFMWRNSGPRPTVEVKHIFTLGPESLRLLSVIARNRGRSGAQATGWALETNSKDETRKNLFFQILVEGSADRQAALDEGSSVEWHIEWGAVEEAAERIGFSAYRPLLYLGSGREVRGKWSHLDGKRQSKYQRSITHLLPRQK